MNEPVAATPEVESAAATVVEAPPSIADHAAKFGPNASTSTDEDADETPPPKRRSNGSTATPEDVETIASLTKELRETESALGIPTIERKQGESQRVYDLRRRTEIAKAMLGAGKRTPEPEQRREPPAQPGAFTKAKPTWDQFANEDDPGTAYYEALSDWKWEKREHEQRETRAKEQAETFGREQAGRHQASIAAHLRRNAEFVKTHPDYDAVRDSSPFASTNIPPALTRAIVESDNSSAIVYALAKYPDDFAEFILTSRNLEPDDESAALLRRRLDSFHSRTLAVTTGAAVSASPTRVLSRPPTPVRTGGAIKVAEEFDGEPKSIRDHAKAHMPKRRH